jgi:hypothetical protein
MNSTSINSRDITGHVFNPASLHSQKTTELQRTDIHDNCTARNIKLNVRHILPLGLFKLLAF